jgi:hypothetical protein
MKRIVFLRLLLLALFVIPMAPSAAAADFSHPTGFKFWLPDNWKVEADGDYLVSHGQGGRVYLEFMVPKNLRSMDRALDELEDDLSGWMKNIHYDRPSLEHDGDIGEYFITGTGKDRSDGEEMEFDLGIYEKKGKFLMVFGVTTADNFDKYDKTFTKILHSIR